MRATSEVGGYSKALASIKFCKIFCNMIGISFSLMFWGAYQRFWHFQAYRIFADCGTFVILMARLGKITYKIVERPFTPPPPFLHQFQKPTLSFLADIYTFTFSSSNGIFWCHSHGQWLHPKCPNKGLKMAHVGFPIHNVFPSLFLTVWIAEELWICTSLEICYTRADQPHICLL